MKIRVIFSLLMIGIPLTATFAIMKWIGAIQWSWWIVCIPLFVSVGLTLLILAGLLIFVWLFQNHR